MPFGRKQLKNPTPSGISTFIQAFTVVTGTLVGWIGTANFIPVHTSSILQSVLGLLIGIANGIKPFFGVETTQEKIPIEQVGEMEAK